MTDEEQRGFVVDSVTVDALADTIEEALSNLLSSTEHGNEGAHIPKFFAAASMACGVLAAMFAALLQEHEDAGSIETEMRALPWNVISKHALYRVAKHHGEPDA